MKAFRRCFSQQQHVEDPVTGSVSASSDIFLHVSTALSLNIGELHSHTFCRSAKLSLYLSLTHTHTHTLHTGKHAFMHTYNTHMSMKCKHMHAVQLSARSNTCSHISTCTWLHAQSGYDLQPFLFFFPSFFCRPGSQTCNQTDNERRRTPWTQTGLLF